MPLKRRSLLFSCGLLLFGLTGSSANATTLTFDQGVVMDFQPGSQDYGDDVEATLEGSFGYGVSAEGFTPDVQVTYGPGPRLWTAGFGDLTNSLFIDQGAAVQIEITLTAGTGFEVELFGFDLAAFTSDFASDPVINAVTISDGTTTLFAQPNAVVSRTTHTTFDFSAGPLSGQTVAITIDVANLGSLRDSIAIDNVRFGQAIPEPSTALLVGLGLLGLSYRRAKQHRAR